MKLLSIGTYPIIDCTHGGQIRTSQLIGAYKNILGSSNVEYVSVYNPHTYAVKGINDVAISEVSIKKIRKMNYAEDVICGLAIDNDPEVKKAIKRIFDIFEPTIVECSQLFTYLGLKNFLKQYNLKVKLIYSSHNIENVMKRNIYKAHSQGKTEEVFSLIKKIESAEIELSKKAALTICVSEDDAETLKSYGANNIVIVPNAVVAQKVPEAEVINWKSYLIKHKVRKSIVFIGSAHLPNLTGFEELVADRPGFLDIFSKIYVVGSVCDLLLAKHKKNDISDLAFFERIVLLGKLSDTSMRALIKAANVVILPILEGGGSNLKTAEALYYGNSVVATKVAMRSFGSFKDFPNIAIANSPKEFKLAILSQLNKFTDTDQDNHTYNKMNLTWGYATKPLTYKLFEELR